VPKAKSKPEATIGRCIYCPDTTGPLGEEHILAANLGGDVTLLKACCPVCQKEINENIEQPCLQKMLRDIRYKRGVGTRRKNKRPSGLEAYVRTSDRGTLQSLPNTDPENWIKVSLPYENHPTMLVLPAFDAPGIMRGLTPEETNRQDNPGYWFWTGKTNGCEENKYGAVTKTSLRIRHKITASFPRFRGLMV